ncbi:hypothetical protein BigBertha_273 [Bacillus phage BigBertha]|uniref:Uncharacterized protein n=3 Tax=Bequatrovirus TaxID=1917990 RepID=A0A7U3TT74_9CAUD|nr:hypothetical protein BigBertha_273 [Bacillus phage BigBertha]YP_009290153.1 hypothetical protein BI003_gp274 [Bacillus phage Phrodo]AMW61548.1 hypothetical protein JUGLONE_276 [Bacillus phage Juglone]QPY77507.1 hypothetical protein ANTHOS_271 [Bacillus phage Anthos]AGY46781.1 hypothetical protein BigBertha_273 [Bacillus phage BigBertha]AMW62313.1 hypothetical protein PHRODO_274 [Bacillus phage Phrodo]
MFNLRDEVYMNGNKNRVWLVVGISNNTVCAVDKLPMIKVISGGLVTYAKQCELEKVNKGAGTYEN